MQSASGLLRKKTNTTLEIVLANVLSYYKKANCGINRRINMVVKRRIYTVVAALVSFSFLQATLDIVDFDTSMDFYKNDSFVKKRLAKMNHKLTQFCRDMYEQNKALEPMITPIIPKIIHIIWVGPKTPPPILDECLESIKKHMPTWECKIWTDAEVSQLSLENQQYYDEETNYGAKSDILRYELLYRFGGVYLDVDFVFLKPLDFLHHTYEFYTGLMPSYTRDVLSNGIIGCVPGHPIMQHCINTIKEHRIHKKDIIKRTGPIHFQQSFYAVTKNLTHKRIIALPKSYFLPLDENDVFLSVEDQKTYIKPEAFSVHYWANTWSTKNTNKTKES